MNALKSTMKSTLDNPYYYLDNFTTVLAWVHARYSDLLNRDEIDLIENFASLPRGSQALFVRMVMRKGSLFRASKLVYEEIGDTQAAMSCLVELGWIEHDPLITVDQLFALLTKNEVVQALAIPRDKAGATKPALLEAAQALFNEAHRFSVWYAAAQDTAYAIRISDCCDRIRLMFFGNLHQDWSEFVLADLGIFIYEKVEFSPASRAFHTRRDVDDYVRLHACRERLYNDAPLEEVEHEIAAIVCETAWLNSRRAKLLFQIGQRYEQQQEWGNALRIYAQTAFPGARMRRIRLLEKDAQYAAAIALATEAEAAPESEAEVQHLMRIMPRLRRKLGHAVSSMPMQRPVPRIDLCLPKPGDDYYVEEVVRQHVEQTSEQSNEHAPAHYVENTLINSLFGLLCWDAIFTAVPGAFFHPFHIGPVDLHSPDFYRQRATQFHACLSQLDSTQYQQTIRENFRRKAGIQSPFVAWEWLSETLLEQALTCIPAAHLAKWFERMLRDISANCAGLPDLIQFWPQEARYRMIEVKGPGDRLQDNQIRWLDYCMQHDMPVAVCYVQWEEEIEQSAEEQAG